MKVAGVYDTGYQELDKTLAYASLALADRILSPRASRAMIGVKVRDPFGGLAPVSRRVAAAAGDARVATWREIEYARLASFRTTKALLLFIMALIVLVACVNVSSVVLMIVFERRHDLGILKSVGAGPRALSLSFLLSGFRHRAAGDRGGHRRRAARRREHQRGHRRDRVDGQSCPGPRFPASSPLFRPPHTRSALLPFSTAPTT